MRTSGPPDYGRSRIFIDASFKVPKILPQLLQSETEREDVFNFFYRQTLHEVILPKRLDSAGVGIKRPLNRLNRRCATAR